MMRGITIAKWVAIAVAGVGILWLAFHPRSHGPVTMGERAPGFTLPQLPSGNLSLSQYKGRVVVLNFWATWCPPCVMETPSLEQFATDMKSSGVTVIGVSVDKDENQLKQFIQQFHLSYPVARDPSSELAHRYGTYKFPETYIIGRDGHVAEKIIGATNWTDPRMLTFVKSLTGTTEASR
jgi:cytochrome c biogenesis protein CcmG, thiol:disulfide interchange protein DsbE